MMGGGSGQKEERRFEERRSPRMGLTKETDLERRGLER